MCSSAAAPGGVGAVSAGQGMDEGGASLQKAGSACLEGSASAGMGLTPDADIARPAIGGQAGWPMGRASNSSDAAALLPLSPAQSRSANPRLQHLPRQH